MVEKQLISQQISQFMFTDPIKTDSFIYKKISSFLKDKQYYRIINKIQQFKHLGGLPDDFTYLDKDGNSHTYQKCKTYNNNYIYKEVPEHILQKHRYDFCFNYL